MSMTTSAKGMQRVAIGIKRCHRGKSSGEESFVKRCESGEGNQSESEEGSPFERGRRVRWIVRTC